jgi:hypothetical protein
MLKTNAIWLKIISLMILSIFLSLSSAAQKADAAPTQARSASGQVSGVGVTLEHIPSGKRLITKTDEKGVFTFRDVGPGSYKLRIGCAEVSGQDFTRSGRTESSNKEGTQGESERCHAEFRVEISDKSEGNISGVVRRSSDGK